MQNAWINTAKIIFINGITCAKYAAISLHSTTAWHLAHDTWVNWKILRLSIKFYKLNEQFLQLTQCQSWIRGAKKSEWLRLANTSILEKEEDKNQWAAYNIE